MHRLLGGGVCRELEFRYLVSVVRWRRGVNFCFFRGASGGLLAEREWDGVHSTFWTWPYPVGFFAVMFLVGAIAYVLRGDGKCRVYVVPGYGKSMGYVRVV